MPKAKPKLRSSVQKRLVYGFMPNTNSERWLFRQALVCRRFARTMYGDTHRLWIVVGSEDAVDLQRNKDDFTFTIRINSRFLAFFFSFARRVRLVEFCLQNWELSGAYCRFAASVARILEGQPKLKKLVVNSWDGKGAPLIALLSNRITTLTCSLRELACHRSDRPLDLFDCRLFFVDENQAVYYALRVPAHRVSVWQYGKEPCKLQYFAKAGVLPPNPHLKHFETYVNLVPEGIRLLGQREDGRAERLDTWRRALECFKRVNPQMSLSFREQLDTFCTRLRLIHDRAQELMDLSVDVVGIKITRINAHIRVGLAKERKCTKFRARVEAVIEQERRWKVGGDVYRKTAMQWDLGWSNGNSPDFEYDEEEPAEWQDEWDVGRLCVSEQAAELFGSFLVWTGD